MSARAPKNIVGSVLERLRNRSKSSGAPFQQVLQQYAIERFLYRISKSKHAQSLILKGALLLKTVGVPNARPTMDIDMLRKGKADQATLVALVKDCATLEVAADGLSFLPASVVAEDIAKDSEYQGSQILMDAEEQSYAKALDAFRVLARQDSTLLPIVWQGRALKRLGRLPTRRKF
jgi:hypothetical protein